jgi:hypothetical protein
MKSRPRSKVPVRRDTLKSHLITEERHDPYKATRKRADPGVCPQCMAVYLAGRWRWVDTALPKAQWQLCPACHRIKDKYPAGRIMLMGKFLAKHGPEIMRLVRNVEAIERREHPLQRIMEVQPSDDRTVITTTDIHLPRRVGHALVGAYKGKLETKYDQGGYFVDMRWRRD